MSMILRILAISTLLLTLTAFGCSMFIEGPPDSAGLWRLRFEEKLVVLSVLVTLLAVIGRLWFEVEKGHKAMRTTVRDLESAHRDHSVLMTQALEWLGLPGYLALSPAGKNGPIADAIYSALQDLVSVLNKAQKGVLVMGGAERFSEFVCRLYKNAERSLVASTLWPAAWWTRAEGLAYIAFNRELLARGICIRRVFLFRRDQRDEVDRMMPTMQQQAMLGIEVYLSFLDPELERDLYVDLGLVDDGECALMADVNEISGSGRSTGFTKVNGSARPEIGQVQGLLDSIFHHPSTVSLDDFCNPGTQTG